MTKNKKSKFQYLNFFYEKNFQKLTIFLLIILIATAMAGRKQFVLDPYESYDTMYKVNTITLFGDVAEQIHPIYAEGFYTPSALKLVPPSFLNNNWFHVFSAIAFLSLTIGGIFTLIRMAGFTTYQSMAMALFTLYTGSLITRELFGIALLAPSPFISYGYYTVRTPVIPLSIFGLIFLINRRFIIGGLLIGLATFFHIKFGFRFFGLLFFSLLLWKFWSSKRVGWSQEHLTWNNIATFVISWGGVFVITYAHIMSGMRFLDTLDLPQSETFISQLALLIKNEPDDWLINYYFGESRPFIGFLVMTVSIGLFCELIIRYSPTNQMKRFAVFWEIVTIVALAFFGAGFLFESFLINWLPVSISHTIMLTRFWELVWVVVVGFWVTLLPAVTLVAGKIMNRFNIPESTVENVFFHLAIIVFLCANTAIFLINKGGEVIKVSKIRNGEIPFLKVGNYVQICGPVTTEYNKVYREAIKSLQTKDDKEFREALFRMDTIFNEFKVNLNNPPLRNPDSAYLSAINHSQNGSFSEIINLSTAENKETYWWSCSHSEPGIHTRSIQIPTKDYIDATDWIKFNLPINQGVIQPPYLPKFTMFSQRIAFWDEKVDQHMMYMLKEYYGAGLHRLRSVAGPYSMTLEAGAKHGKLGPSSREYFLRIEKKDIIKIRQKYPKYSYFLTENHNLLGYSKIYSNSSLTLYDISDPS
jgi:hypothetical protein